MRVTLQRGMGMRNNKINARIIEHELYEFTTTVVCPMVEQESTKYCSIPYGNLCLLFSLKTPFPSMFMIKGLLLLIENYEKEDIHMILIRIE